MEVELGGVDELRIGDDRAGVLAGLCHSARRQPTKVTGWPAALPVEVALELEVLSSFQLLPRSGPRLPVDDVVLEGEREVRLDARALDLVLLAKAKMLLRTMFSLP